MHQETRSDPNEEYKMEPLADPKYQDESGYGSAQRYCFDEWACKSRNENGVLWLIIAIVIAVVLISGILIYRR